MSWLPAWNTLPVHTIMRYSLLQEGFPQWPHASVVTLGPTNCFPHVCPWRTHLEQGAKYFPDATFSKYYALSTCQLGLTWHHRLVSHTTHCPTVLEAEGQSGCRQDWLSCRLPLACRRLPPCHLLTGLSVMVSAARLIALDSLGRWD